MKWIGALAIVAALCCACGSSGSSKTAAVTPTPTVTSTGSPTPSPSSTPTTLTLHPVLVIHSGTPSLPFFRATGPGFHHCHGINGASAFHVQTSVTMYGPSGRRVIGIGHVVRSRVDAAKRTCVLVSTVRHLPDLPFYEVQFGTDIKLAFTKHSLLKRTRTTNYR